MNFNVATEVSVAHRNAAQASLKKADLKETSCERNRTPNRFNRQWSTAARHQESLSFARVLSLWLFKRFKSIQAQNLKEVNLVVPRFVVCKEPRLPYWILHLVVLEWQIHTKCNTCLGEYHRKMVGCQKWTQTVEK